MKSLSVREMRSAIRRLDEILARNGEMILTRRGRPVARLLPLRANRAVPSHKDLREKMPKLVRGSEVLVREDRDAR